MSDDGHVVNVPRSLATGWPTIEDLSAFTGVAVGDVTLQSSLDKAIDYGNLVLGDRYEGAVSESIFGAALEYAGSIYTERIGQSDPLETYQGTVTLARYRRILLANRFVGIA